MTAILCRVVAPAAVFGLMLAGAGGCANTYSSPQQQAYNACSVFGPKSIGGGLAGGLGGAAIGATAGGGRGAAIGAGLGLLTGLVVGKTLDTRDCQQARIALQAMATTQIGQPVAWSSPSGSHGSYTPVAAAYTTPDNRICRQVRSNVALAGHEPTSTTELTCRNSNGDWEPVTA